MARLSWEHGQCNCSVVPHCVEAPQMGLIFKLTTVPLRQKKKKEASFFLFSMGLDLEELTHWTTLSPCIFQQWSEEKEKKVQTWQVFSFLFTPFCSSASLSLCPLPSPPSLSLFTRFLFSLSSESPLFFSLSDWRHLVGSDGLLVQVHSCYCKITERLIETNDYNNRTLSPQAAGRGSFN